jgi:hypothetical protein
MSTDRRLRFAHRFKTGALCEIEIDLEAVRDSTFTPRFRWKGRTYKGRELIAWVCSVFAEVASRTGVPIVWCFVHRGSGLTESWVFEPNKAPRKVAKADEPSAILLAAAGKFATQCEKED